MQSFPMRKVSLDEIVGIERYEQIRDEFRRSIIELKRHRRVAVGPNVTFVFENHETMLFQIQEMLRAESIVDLDKVREEIAVYNVLVPDPGELSATLLIEITQADNIRDELIKLIGIDESVWLEIGGEHRIQAEFEAGRSKEDKLSAVQYVRFPVADAVAVFRDPTIRARLVIDHPNYQAAAVIDGAVRASLIEDLAG